MGDRALDDLIAAVEAGGDLEDMWMVPTAIGISPNTDRFIAAFNGSLDAAKALHEALLPGWQRQISESNAKVYERPNIAFFGEVVGNDARAWLLAILRARAALAKMGE